MNYCLYMYNHAFTFPDYLSLVAFRCGMRIKKHKLDFPRQERVWFNSTHCNPDFVISPRGESAKKEQLFPAI